MRARSLLWHDDLAEGALRRLRIGAEFLRRFPEPACLVSLFFSLGFLRRFRTELQTCDDGLRHPAELGQYRPQ